MRGKSGEMFFIGVVFLMMAFAWMCINIADATKTVRRRFFKPKPKNLLPDTSDSAAGSAEIIQFPAQKHRRG